VLALILFLNLINMKNKFLIINLAVLTILFIGAGCSQNTDTVQNKPAGDTSQVTNTQNTPEPVTVTVKTTTGQTTTNPTTPVVKPTPTPTPTPTPPVDNGPKTFTMAEVTTHNSASSCYTTIKGNVYDVTTYIPNHPGGAANILKICGKDGASAFTEQHDGQPKPEQMLASLKIGVLK